MTYMEKPLSGRVLLDDTVPLTAVIEASQNAQSHTEYIIRVQRGVSAENSWQVIRRYSDFDLLNNSLMVCGISLLLPPKKLIGNMDRDFIAEDRGDYRPTWTQLPSIPCFPAPCLSKSSWIPTATQPITQKSPCSKSQCSSGQTSNGKSWSLSETWVDLGPHMFLSDKDLQSAMKWLTSITVPYLCPLLFSSVSESSAMLIRPFSETGSLRDHICKVKPKECYLKKYCNPKKREGLPLQDIKKYGRQILEGLKVLHEAGLFYGHLHASNVIVDGDVCRLVDVENGLLGVPSFLRPAFTQHRKINTMESVDVFSFGVLLYEMTYGRPADSVPVNHYPAAPSAAVVSVLQSILSAEACKGTMPTVAELLQTPFFRDVHLQPSEKPIKVRKDSTAAPGPQASATRLIHPVSISMQISNRLKEALKAARQSNERRLQEEQKAVRSAGVIMARLTRAQSHHCSDEERKRRKILARKVAPLAPSRKPPAPASGSGSGASSPPTCPSSPTPSSTTGAQSDPPPAPPLDAFSSCPPPPPPPPPPLSSPDGVAGSRSALLSSIQTFRKGKLKKTE
ncbi:unnamed protein product, partial [Tetraodon nigroviridis]